MAIDKNSKAYQSLLKSWYTDEQINQMSGAVAWGQSAKDVIANTKVGSTTPTSTNTQTNVSTPTVSSANTVKPEYQWQWSTNAKQSTWQDQWNGNYTYNQKTWYYERVWDTSNTPSTTSTATTPANSNVSKIADGWNNMSYAQQQAALKKNPSLQQVLDKYWITSKQPETVTNQTPTTSDTSTPKTDKWDYQDNSQARMDEIADNLNKYRVTNPGLFQNYDDFYNFFIKGKGRSQEQIDFLNSYFNNVNKFNSYDNMSAPVVWELIARWEVPDDYLNYVKYTDPNRYAEIMDNKDKAEKGIENESYYSTILEQAWFTADTDNLKRQTKEWIWLDTDNNWIDDRRYHEPTEEERKLIEENNEYEAERLKLNNAMKDLQSDLTEQYPDADLSTIMLLTSDRWNKIQKALDTISVSQTKVQWTIKYLQSERQQLDKAGADSIAQLQKNLWMYYTYSPEWMSELAQAQYAATNVTLDQADNWTDTQKQMALDSVLSDYFDKYGSIIRRSKSQVINDVMAYAKKNGVSLSQALEDNFLKYLRQKPWFKQLNSVTSNPDVFKVWDNAYAYWDENWNLVQIWWWILGWWTSNWQLYWFTDYTPISTEQKESVLDNFMNTRTEGSDWWQCWEFVNDYLQALWYDRLYDDPIDKKKAITNSKEATVWSIAVMDSQKYPQYWHVAIVTDVQWDKVKLLESNRNNDEKVHTTRWVDKSEIAWYFDPSKQPSSWMKRNPDLETFLSKWKDAEWDRLKEKDFWSTFWAEIEAKWVSKEDFLKQYQEFHEYESRDAYLDILSRLDHLIELTWKDFWHLDRVSAMSWIWDVWNIFDFLKNNLTMDAIAEARDKWAKLWVLSDSDVKMLREAASALDWDDSQETWADELYKFRNQLLSHNKYLKDAYDIQSAYSTNKWFKYDNDSKSWAIWTKKEAQSSQNNQQQTTQKQAKSIKSLSKLKK